MCLSEEGQIITMGGNGGHEPRLVDKLIGITTTFIACGEQHYVALDDNGDLYTWGGM